jgi:hypothetical protein
MVHHHMPAGPQHACALCCCICIMLLLPWRVLLCCCAQVPGLSDPTMVRGILTRWPVAADHIMCVSPHEPPLFKFSKCPTSFVGHPSVQKVINQQAPGTPHKKQQQQQPQPPKAAANQAWFASDKLRQRANVWKWDGVFADGSAARFWAQHGSQLSRPAAAKGKAGEGPSGISSSSSIHSSKRRPLVALFPGRLERDMAQLMEPLGEWAQVEGGRAGRGSGRGRQKRRQRQCGVFHV